MTSIEEIKREVLSRSNLVQEIRKDGYELKRDGVHWVMRCPFHAEDSPSFKIKDGEQHFHCYGCGAHGDIFSWVVKHGGRQGKMCGKDFVAAVKTAASRMGIQVEDQKEKKIFTLEKLKESVEWQASEHKEKVEDIYEYVNPDTKAIEHIVFRLRGIGKKRILQAMPNGDGFSFGAPDGARPIFNRSRIREVQNVVIVEGENKVKALHALGIVATCSSGGANAGTKADWSPVAGKCVTFWRDFDEPGEKLQSDVIAELEKLTPPPDIYIIDVTALGLGDGEDCIDYIANLTGSPQEIASIVQNVIASAHSTGGYGALEKHIEEILSGRWFNVPFVWSLTTRYTRALVPGSVCVFCGGAGSTKSFSVIQNLRFWKNRGILACALMLEDGETFHMQRLLAQIAGNGNLTDDEWMRSHQEQTRSLRDLAKPELKEMEKYINAISDPMAMTVESLLGWIEAKCRDGFRIVCIDPITAMVKGQYGFNDDFRFLMGAKKIIEKYKASLLLVTHPRKMAANAKDAPFTMSDLSGGVCYERFAHCIISLRKLDVPKDANIRSEMGVLQNFSSNRELSIMKSRNARGNATISLNFEDATLELRELGISENDE